MFKKIDAWLRCSKRIVFARIVVQYSLSIHSCDSCWRQPHSCLLKQTEWHMHSTPTWSVLLLATSRPLSIAKNIVECRCGHSFAFTTKRLSLFLDKKGELLRKGKERKRQSNGCVHHFGYDWWSWIKRRNEMNNWWYSPNLYQISFERAVRFHLRPKLSSFVHIYCVPHNSIYVTVSSWVLFGVLFILNSRVLFLMSMHT